MYFVKHELYFVKHDAHEQICKNSVTYFFQVEFFVSSYNLPCIPCTMLPVVLHSETVFRDGSRKNPWACYRKSQGQDDMYTKLVLHLYVVKESCQCLMSALTSLEATGKPLATSIFNLVQDLLSYLESGTSNFWPRNGQAFAKIKALRPHQTSQRFSSRVIKISWKNYRSIWKLTVCLHSTKQLGSLIHGNYRPWVITSLIIETFQTQEPSAQVLEEFQILCEL